MRASISTVRRSLPSARCKKGSTPLKSTPKPQAVNGHRTAPIIENEPPVTTGGSLIYSHKHSAAYQSEMNGADF